MHILETYEGENGRRPELMPPCHTCCPAMTFTTFVLSPVCVCFQQDHISAAMTLKVETLLTSDGFVVTLFLLTMHGEL